MPNSKDSAKRNRQNRKLRIHNRSIRSRIRTSIKSVEHAIEVRDKPAAESAFRGFVKLVDTATGKGIYHRNTSARKKSRLHKRMNSLQ